MSPLLLHVVNLSQLPLVLVVDKVAPGSVGTESDRVEGPAKLRLVLGVAGQGAQLGHAVSELTLVAILAVTVLLERAT